MRLRTMFGWFTAVVWCASASAQGVHTDRPTPRALQLAADDDAFSFVVFGDRTGGPAEGIRVLAQAVEDTVLLDPDLVMTVGDLVQGYNTREPWMAQMREYQQVMSRLPMPWFPVAGNHDIYWRGDGRPAGEHQDDYEQHFGPLWYAFEHKGCWFIVLYSDEGNPDTDERDFNRPDCQRMSDAQFAWLQGILAKARGARHVFAFLHHPRWDEGRYGDDWRKVHRAFADAGNVTAVFAGHIHRVRYYGKVDGIEYHTLATVGGHLSGEIAGGGYLHHLHHVTVRDAGIQIACLPVGSVLDPRKITAEINTDVGVLSEQLAASMSPRVVMERDGRARGEVVVTVTNPVARPIEVTLAPMIGDRHWSFRPDHVHQTVKPGGALAVHFALSRTRDGLDENLALPEIELGVDYLGDGLRVTLPPRRLALDVAPPRFDANPSAANRALDVGAGRVASLDNRDLALPDGAFTVEGWLLARDLTGRRGFINKTESSEFGLFVSGGRPSFLVHLDGEYVSAATDRALVTTGEWHHLAGVYDGAEVRLYVDGERVAAAPARGARTRNDLPLFIGADTDGRGRATSEVDGWIDDVRISTTARYRGDRFKPSRRLRPDEGTVLLLKMDESRGPWLLDGSSRHAHPILVGGARLVDPAEDGRD